MWGIMKGRREGLEFYLFKLVVCLAALPGGERGICALTCIKGTVNTLQARTVSLPHKTMFGEISLGREFGVETGKEKESLKLNWEVRDISRGKRQQF